MKYQKTSIPNFFRDETNLPCEALLDYFISWTLRCAVDSVAKENELLNNYAKQLLAMCIFNDPTKLDGKSVSECRSWKQESKVDLWFEVVVEGEKYAVVFENKAHTHMHDNQLKRYYDEVEQYYNGTNIERVYIYLTQKDNFNDGELTTLKNSHFKPLLLDTLTSVVWNGKDIEEQQLTGSDLFDAFWFRWWA